MMKVKQEQYCKVGQHQDQLTSRICQLIYAMLPFGLRVNLYLSIDEFKAGECQGSCRCCSQQVRPTTFVEPSEAISMPHLQRDINLRIWHMSQICDKVTCACKQLGSQSCCRCWVT